MSCHTKYLHTTDNVLIQMSTADKYCWRWCKHSLSSQVFTEFIKQTTVSHVVKHFNWRQSTSFLLSKHRFHRHAGNHHDSNSDYDYSNYNSQNQIQNYWVWNYLQNYKTLERHTALIKITFPSLAFVCIVLLSNQIITKHDFANRLKSLLYYISLIIHKQQKELVTTRELEIDIKMSS